MDADLELDTDTLDAGDLARVTEAELVHRFATRYRWDPGTVLDTPYDLLLDLGALVEADQERERRARARSEAPGPGEGVSMGPELPSTSTNESAGTPGYQAMRAKLDELHRDAAGERR